MKVISIINQKGGVGKTTTALNLGYALYKKNYRVLMIDLDSQGSLSFATGIKNRDLLPYDLALLLQNEINNTPCDIDNTLIELNKSEEGGKFYLIPGNIKLSSIQNSIYNALSREYLLRDILNSVTEKHEFDFVIIDCSPSLSILTTNALVVSDEVIIPVNPSELSLVGIVDLLNSVENVRKKINPNLHIAGVLATMVDTRSNYVKNLLKELHSIENVNVFRTIIPYSSKASEPLSLGISTIEYNKNLKLSKAYLHFTNELLKKTV